MSFKVDLIKAGAVTHAGKLWFCKHTSRVVSNQTGQAMTEYLILIFLVALVCLPIARMLPAAIIEYVRPFYYCLSRPIP